MNNNLQISVYLKSHDKADVVFRKKDVLYRIGIMGAKKFLVGLADYLMNLRHALLFQLDGKRMRKWVLELGIVADDEAVLQVWEMVAGEMKSCFNWAGSTADLHRAVRRK